MAGATPGSGRVTCTHPRLVGRRLQTLTVIAGKPCRPAPNLSSDRGWTWNWRVGVACSGEDLAKAPSCDGAMVSGPRRSAAYSSAISGLRHHWAYSAFRVGTPLTS